MRLYSDFALAHCPPPSPGERTIAGYLAEVRMVLVDGGRYMYGDSAGSLHLRRDGDWQFQHDRYPYPTQARPADWWLEYLRPIDTPGSSP